MFAKTVRMFDHTYRDVTFYCRHMLHKQGTEPNTSIILPMTTDGGAFPSCLVQGHLEGSELDDYLERFFKSKKSASQALFSYSLQ